MSPSRDKILGAIRANKPAAVAHPGDFTPVRSVDPFATYADRIKLSGGEAVRLLDESLADAVTRLFSDCGTRLSFVADVPSTTALPADDAGYTALDLAVIPGRLAVAENGAVWVDFADDRARRASLLARDVALVVPAGALVATMHDAFAHPAFRASCAGQGVFLSGPSKTADIEQCLVIGAHGPCSLRVFFV
jgi:L-lactate dehydrogenase complex protein LldG